MATILIVEDERVLAEVYASWLKPDHDVIVTYSGPEAVDAFSPVVDVVLLDRRMPGMSGDEVLDRMDLSRTDCRVAMVTAVDPDFDIVEMPIDDYLVKPVTPSALRETVETLLELAYDQRVRDLYAAAAKLAALEAAKPAQALEQNDAYVELRDEFRILKADADGLLVPARHDRFGRFLDEMDPERVSGAERRPGGV